MAMMACIAGFVAIWFRYPRWGIHREIVGIVGGLLLK